MPSHDITFNSFVWNFSIFFFFYFAHSHCVLFACINFTRCFISLTRDSFIHFFISIDFLYFSSLSHNVPLSLSLWMFLVPIGYLVYVRISLITLTLVLSLFFSLFLDASRAYKMLCISSTLFDSLSTFMGFSNSPMHWSTKH